MTKNKQSVGYLYDVALLLVCLAFLSSYFASGLLAKFVSGGGKDDGARVAQWSASASAGARMELLPSGNGRITYPITVTRNAESASTCHITVVFDEDMSSIIESPHIGSITPDEGASFTDTLTFRNVSKFPATGGATVVDTFDLIMDVPGAYASLIVDDYDNDIINGMIANIPFTLTVDVEQID